MGCCGQGRSGVDSNAGWEPFRHVNAICIWQYKLTQSKLYNYKWRQQIIFQQKINSTLITEKCFWSSTRDIKKTKEAYIIYTIPKTQHLVALGTDFSFYLQTSILPNTFL